MAATEVAPSRNSSWRRNVTFKAMGWGLKESCDNLQLLAGDRLDIAYCARHERPSGIRRPELTVQGRDAVK